MCPEPKDQDDAVIVIDSNDQTELISFDIENNSFG